MFVRVISLAGPDLFRSYLLVSCPNVVKRNGFLSFQRFAESIIFKSAGLICHCSFSQFELMTVA